MSEKYPNEYDNLIHASELANKSAISNRRIMLLHLRDLEEENKKLREITNEIEYHTQGMGCGLEDLGITDRYEAMNYGWEEAMKRVEEALRDGK